MAFQVKIVKRELIYASYYHFSHRSLYIRMNDRIESRIYWYRPIDRQPTRVQIILVKYDGQIWPGVYVKGWISLYTENHTKIEFIDCTWWAALPRPPAKSRAEALT